MSETRRLFDSLYYNQANVWLTTTILVWVTLVIAAHRELFLGFHRATGLEHQQLKTLFYAFATGYIGGTSSILPAFGIMLYPYGNFSVPLYCFIVTYAILKHHLMDITVVIRKSVIYSVLVAFITVTYLVFVLVAERLLQGVMGYWALAP